jgi:hypothetical protein
MTECIYIKCRLSVINSLKFPKLDHPLHSLVNSLSKRLIDARSDSTVKKYYYSFMKWEKFVNFINFPKTPLFPLPGTMTECIYIKWRLSVIQSVKDLTQSTGVKIQKPLILLHRTGLVKTIGSYHHPASFKSDLECNHCEFHKFPQNTIISPSRYNDRMYIYQMQ